MTEGSALSIVAAAVQLALVLFVGLRAPRSLLGLPLIVLAAVLCVFNAATAARTISGYEGWRYVDATASSLTMATAFHFVVVFAGGRRRYARHVLAAYLVFGAIAATCSSAFVVDATKRFPGSNLWAVVLLLAVVPFASFAALLLMRHLRVTSDAKERMRTRLVFAALIVGALLGSTDLWRELAIVRTFAVPPLANVGTLVSTGLLAVVTLRFSLFERDPGGLTAIVAGALALGAVVAYLGAFSVLADRAALLVFAVTVVSLVSAMAVRALAKDFAVYREGLRRHAMMGRFSAQMAHDLENPIASIRGAAQVVQGRDLPEVQSMMALIVEQTRRLEQIVDGYQRLARVEPNLEDVDVEALAHRVARGFEVTAATAVVVEGRRRVRADARLLEGALENVLANAHEAGGRATLIVRDQVRGDREGVAFVVEDDGPGMSPRVAAEATEEFYTTKAEGTGLGLSFARRVAEAHGGALDIESRRVGAAVRLWLPADDHREER